jgi:hypothetical protein
MTAGRDQLKYDYICGLVEKTYPILAPVWQAARARFGAAWLREFVENIEAVYGTVDVGIEGRLGDALRKARQVQGLKLRRMRRCLLP